jgi:predicted nucleotidyltransferase
VQTDPPGFVAEAARWLAAALVSERAVRWAYLFGSAARGEAFADLDVAVMLAPSERGAPTLGSVAARLEQAAGRKPVDVVDLASAAPALAGRIAREGRVLVDREPARRKLWEIEANRRALDIEPWLREFERLRRKALQLRLG